MHMKVFRMGGPLVQSNALELAFYTQLFIIYLLYHWHTCIVCVVQRLLSYYVVLYLAAYCLANVVFVWGRGVLGWVACVCLWRVPCLTSFLVFLCLLVVVRLRELWFFQVFRFFQYVGLSVLYSL